MAESTSKLREQIAALTNVTGQGGFDIMEDEDTFKSTYDIMLGIGKVWEQMSDIDQAALLELLAGKRQGNALAATLTNLEDMQRALEVSENSAGSAMREHEKWLDSIDAKTQQFHASFESLSATVFSTDFIKGVVDAGTGFVQGIDNMIQGVQKIPVITPSIKALTATLAVPLAANAIGSFLFAPRGEEQVSRLTNLGRSAKATQRRVSSLLREGGTLKRKYRRAGAVFDGAEVFTDAGELKAAATAINPYTAAIFGLVAAFAALYGIRKQYLNDIEKRRDRASEELDEVNKHSQSIQDYKDRVKELRKELDSGELTSDQELAKRTELAQIQAELTALVGDQAAALDLVNGKLEEQLSLMDALSEGEYKKWKAENREAIDRSVEELSEGWTKVSNMDVKENLRGNDAYLKGYQRLVDEIRKNPILGDDIADQFAGNALNDFGLNLSKYDAWEALEIASELDSVIEDIGEKTFGDNWQDYFGGLSKGAGEATKQAQDLLDTNEQFFNQYAQNELMYNDKYKGTYSDLLAAQQDFKDAYEKGDKEAMKSAMNRQKEYRDQLADMGIDDSALEKYLTQQNKKWDEQFGNIEVQLDLETNIQKNKQQADALLNDLKSNFTKEGKIDISEMFNIGSEFASGKFTAKDLDLSAQQQTLIDFKNAADDAGVSFSDFVQAWASVEGIELSQDQVAGLEAVSNAIENIPNKEVELGIDIDGDGNIGEVAEDVENLHDKDVKVKVDVNGDGQIDDLDDKMAKAEGTHDSIVKVQTVGKKAVDSLNKSITNTKGKDVKVQAKTSGKKDVGLLAGAISTVKKKAVSVSANVSGTQAVKSLASAIASVKGKAVNVVATTTQWVITKYKTERENWTGTTHATEGLSLVGERGEELVQSKGKAYFVGTHHPEVVYLKEGDIVYNAQETKQIKNGSKRIKPQTMNAFADGTNNTGRLTSSYVAPRTRESFHFLPANGEQGDNFKLEEQLKDALGAIDKKVKESLNNYEHQILIMEKNNVNSSELIKVYRDMQAEAARIANDYRAKGLNDNSDYIQELQKQWYEYADKIKELTVQQYEDVRKMSENAIDLNANWLNDAVTNKDYSKVLQYTQNIVQNYKYMQEQIHEEAEYYRSLGYTETSDEVSELSKLWYEYRDKILEATSQAYAGMVEAAGEAVDNMQSLYSTLVEAGEEYAESGHITIDTFQDLVGLGTKYLAFLIDENGMLVINEESIKRVLAAKTKELAVDEALNYVAQIRAAIESGNIDQINALCDATGDLTNASWGLVYAQLSQLNLSEDQYRNALININRLRSLSENAINNIDHELEQMKGDVGDILEYVKEMVKQEVENHIEALEQQIKDYNEIVDLQKESLKLQKEKDEYTKSVAKQTKDIAELQARITQLDLDDSREAQAQKLKLQEELAEKQEKLSDDQSDHSYDATVTALDKMAEAYEKQKNKEIKILENTISSEEKIYQMALKRIDTGWDSLYNDLIHWNTEYGTHLNEEITAAWKEALKMAEKYGDYLTFLNVKKSLDANGNTIYDTSDKKRKDIVGKSYDDSEIRKRTTEMKKNSDEWIRLDKMKTKTPWSNKAKKDELAARNADLAKELEELIGEKLERGTNGVWYIGSVNNGAELYKVYPVYTNHSGGVVAGEKLLPDEAYAKLLKGEVVLNKEQQESVYRRLDALDTLYSKFGNLLGTTGFVNNMNHALYSADDLANIRGAMTDNSVTTLNTTVNVNVGGSIDDEAMARKYGERIGNETIKTINDAFYKRGLNLSGNVLLKQ